MLPYQDLGFAKLDHHRSSRRGFPECVYGAGKTPGQIVRIAKEIAKRGEPVLVTKTTRGVFEMLCKECPKAVWHEQARMITVAAKQKKRNGWAAVLAAGTSDIPVAEEAIVTLEAFGIKTRRVYDVGVAGIHRLFANRKNFEKADVLVVAAGMDGALPSVLAGISRQPVIAIPTSVGYGASFRGLSALLSMLNACAPGVAVVNIDNGFGGGYLAASIIAGMRR